MEAKVYNQEGKEAGSMTLPERVFGAKWNADLVHQVAQSMLSNRRAGTAHTKNRGEVSGGGKKPWRQKGTGRARHGSIRSPIWIGGGVAHGPLKERSYKLDLNKKMKRVAIYSVLSKKFADNEIKIVDSLKLNSHKTKDLASVLKTFLKSVNALLVPTTDNKIVYRAARNIPKVKSLNAASLNVKELLQYKNILIDKEAVKEIK